MNHQSGITGIGTTDHVYVEFKLKREVAGAESSAEDLAYANEAINALATAIDLPTTAGVNPVLGIRPSLWSAVAGEDEVPRGVHDFAEPIRGEAGYEMPATQRDAWLWIHGASRSAVFDALKVITPQVTEYFSVEDHIDGWVYEENRDLTGFEDGTENPGALAAPALVAVPDGEPGAGSSILLYQLWQHRASDWESLSVKDQEDAIGRSKADSIEMDDDVKPEASHVARTVVEVDGEELKVFRRNTAYGTLHDHGTVFVGFTKDQWRMNEMLRRMAGADGGPRDTLTHFTDAVTGAWYVCPSVEALARRIQK